MSEQWYYAVNGQQNGPISTAELKERLARGQIQAGDLVWRPGLANWTSAADAGLVAPRAPQPPPPPVHAPAAPAPQAGPTFPQFPPVPQQALSTARKPQPLVALVVIAAILIAVIGYALNERKSGSAAAGGTAPAAVLTDISGVWQAKRDSASVVLRMADAQPSIEVNGKAIPVTISGYDEGARTVSVAVNGDANMIWTIRQVFANETQFTLEMTLHDGTSDGLTYVRDL